MGQEWPVGARYCAVLVEFDALNEPPGAGHLRLCCEGLDDCEHNRGCLIRQWNVAKHRASSWINGKRSELLKAAPIVPLGIAEARSRSMLLIYEPLETVHDGAAEAASKGFYDMQDAPTWDAWFLYADLFGRSELDHHSSRVLAEVSSIGASSRQSPHLALIRDNPIRVAFVPAHFSRPLPTG